MKCINPIDMGLYVLAKLQDSGAEDTTHLKLQKLLFFIQAFHLACFYDEHEGQLHPIIDGEFEAWMHGPVSRELFKEIRHNVDSGMYENLKVFTSEDEKAGKINEVESRLDQSQIDLVEDVIEQYGNLSGYRLEAITHSQQPWLEARNGLPDDEKCTEVISQDSMRKYFQEFIYAG